MDRKRRQQQATTTKQKLMVAAVMWLMAVMAASSSSANAHAATLPCPFNSMCSCKMTATARRAAEEDGTNLTSSRVQLLLDPDDLDEEFENEEADASDASIVKDVSCVGVPFAALPGTERTTAA